MLRWGFLTLALVLPASAFADYLYGLGQGQGPDPYVLFVADVSGSMAERDAGRPTDCCVCQRPNNCNNCSDKPRCDRDMTRMEALQHTLKDLIPRLDNVSLGLIRFGVRRNILNYCGVDIDNPLPTTSDGKVPTASELIKSVNSFSAVGNTPIAPALTTAKTHLSEVRDADLAAGCRPYAVVILTDGEPNCATSAKKTARQESYEAVDELRKAGIPTYVIGLGKDADKTVLNEMARRGGTARLSSGQWCQRDASGACSTGTALYAETASELTEVFQAAFSEIRRGNYSVMPPIIATVPQEKSEYDRVARNFLAYSSFEMPGYKGHLYGIRLFTEAEDSIGVWEFTDLSEENEKFSLDTCGSDKNPCVFDAGRMLQDRPAAQPRKIYMAVPKSVQSNDGALVLTMDEKIDFGTSMGARRDALEDVVGHLVSNESPLKAGVDALDSFEWGKDDENDEGEALIGDGKLRLEAIADPDDDVERDWQRRVVRWIDGVERPWRLGDIYHSAPAIVTSPPYSYRFMGYPVYKSRYLDRPPMIYIGANDGQIHAFHAADDHFPPEGEEPRWKAGEEAWAYVPYNMVAKVSLAALVGEERVFSQDLSCRVDDVAVVDTRAAEGEIDCSKDPMHEEKGTCGWRTVLVCGQGFGGSWYVALDVTDPFDPIPLWEATHEGIGSGAGKEAYGLGRTWGVPSVGVVNLAIGKDETQPTWISVFGSGYNTDMKDAFGRTSPAYRLLNMPFAGEYPEHGNGTQKEKAHVFVQNLYTGEFLKVFHIHGLKGGVNDQDAILADIPLVSLSRRIFTDVAYVGGWSHGRMDRIAFVGAQTRTEPDDWSFCGGIFHFANSRPLTSRPSAFVDPDKPSDVYLFVGSGIDQGKDPDQQQSQGGQWEFRAYRIEDEGGASCPTSPKNAGNICTDGEQLKNIFQGKARLLAPPTLAVQRDRSKWLTFSTWEPTASTCGEGTSHLYCLDVTAGEKCTPCGTLDGEEGDESYTEIGGHKPQTPGVADGQIYVIGDKGIQRVGNQDGKGQGPAGDGAPNASAPRAVILSWREIF